MHLIAFIEKDTIPVEVKITIQSTRYFGVDCIENVNLNFHVINSLPKL